MAKLIGFLFFATIGVSMLFTNDKDAVGQTQVELGQVQWNRDLEKAKEISTKTGKPLFVQFQEVPG